MCCRADTTRCAIFQQFCCKVMPEVPWGYMSRAKVIMCDTPSHASDHLCPILKGSIQKYRSYRVDMECGTDRWTDRQTDRWTDGCSEANISPQQLHCVGYNGTVMATYPLLSQVIYPCPDSKVPGANMGPTWVLSAPDGPHDGPMNLAIRVVMGLYI